MTVGRKAEEIGISSSFFIHEIEVRLTITSTLTFSPQLKL